MNKLPFCYTNCSTTLKKTICDLLVTKNVHFLSEMAAKQIVCSQAMQKFRRLEEIYVNLKEMFTEDVCTKPISFVNPCATYF